MTRRLITLAATAAIVACGKSPPPPAASAGAPAGVVDSAIPREEALRRFREGIPAADSLAGGATDRDALVQAFVTALERRDTVALRGLVLSRREYAWIYYPTTPQGLPPYDLAPALLWFTLETRSRRGLLHAMQERGGRPLGYVGYICPDTATAEGDNRIWGPCRLRLREQNGAIVEEPLFGGIIERTGRFKFVSYANRLD